MRGDFSRWTYDRSKQYTRVLSLQGRVFLDADFNEGMELQLQHLRKLTADLLGPHAGTGESFQIAPTTPASNDFFITTGSYYVNGTLCESPPVPQPVGGGAADPGPKYSTQPHLSNPPALKGGAGVVYLDVWERFVTYIEDEDRTSDQLQQTIREVALGGPDSAARSQVVWQVRFLPFPVGQKLTNNKDDDLETFKEQLQEAGLIRTIEDGLHSYGKLKARARKPKGDDQPCATNPESRYRGPENQLYRVEIHDAGTIQAGAAGPAPTFKWSRENGAVVFAIRTIEGSTVTLETFGRDDRFGLKPGDLVEVVDDDYVLQNRAEPLLKVNSVDPETFTVILSASPVSSVGKDATKHPILRRWEGAAPVSVNPDPESEGYLSLEDGVEVCFSAKGNYRTSDYWMFPARTATGDVEWPGPFDKPSEIPPHGIIHAYAPLRVVTAPADGGPLTIGNDLRRTIIPLWS